MKTRRGAPAQDATQQVSYGVHIAVFDVPEPMSGLKLGDRMKSKDVVWTPAATGLKCDQYSTVKEVSKAATKFISTTHPQFGNLEGAPSFAYYSKGSQYAPKDSPTVITGEASLLTAIESVISHSHFEDKLYFRWSVINPDSLDSDDDSEVDSEATASSSSKKKAKEKNVKGKRKATGKGAAKGKGKKKKETEAEEMSLLDQQFKHRGEWVTKIRQKYKCASGCKSALFACLVFDDLHLVLTIEMLDLWAAERFKIEAENDENGNAPLADDEGEISLTTPPNSPLFDKSHAARPSANSTSTSSAAVGAPSGAPAPPTIVYNTYYGHGGAAPPPNGQQPPAQPAQQQQQPPPPSQTTYHFDDFPLWLDSQHGKEKSTDIGEWVVAMQRLNIGSNEIGEVSDADWRRGDADGGNLSVGQVIRLKKAWARFKKEVKDGVWKRPEPTE